MKDKKFKILLLNSGYFTGIKGNILEYIIKFPRFFYLRKKIKNQNLNLLIDLIYDEKPDLICLVEVKKENQINYLLNKNYSFCNIENKYWKNSILRKLPYFKNNCNGFISKYPLNFQKHYMKNWTKKLIYEIILPWEISLIMWHFSLNAKTRQKQFQEINQFFSHKDKKIICGDFNIFKGLKETDCFIQNWFKYTHKKSTFPSFKPNKILDLFLCSSNIQAKARVLDIQISDHLPVILKL